MLDDNKPSLDELIHYGMPRRSGRYPWGSGKDPYQHSGDFLSRVEQLSKSGMSEKEIAESKIPGSDAEKRMDQIAASIFGALEAGYDPNDEAFKKHFRDKLGPDFNGDITIIKL